MSAQGNAMGKRMSQNEALETRKAIGVDNAFGKTMLQTKALEARKMSAQGIALGKKEQKGERCKCDRPFRFARRASFQRLMSPISLSGT